MIQRPRRYTFLVCLVLLSTPVFILNIWVMQKGVVSKVFSQDKLVWIGLELAWTLVTMRWLLRASWRGFWSFALMSVAMLAANLCFLVTLKNYALAFYALFLVILAGLYGLHLLRNLQEVFYHPGQRWFEGRPSFLPRIEAEIRVGERLIPARLSRLGTEGCYAYISARGGREVDPGKIDAIALKLGDLNLNCAVELVSKSKDGSGQGLRFINLSADENKDISDFIDRVRSSGYVA